MGRQPGTGAYPPEPLERQSCLPPLSPSPSLPLLVSIIRRLTGKVFSVFAGRWRE